MLAPSYPLKPYKVASPVQTITVPHNRPTSFVSANQVAIHHTKHEGVFPGSSLGPTWHHRLSMRIEEFIRHMSAEALNFNIKTAKANK